MDMSTEKEVIDEAVLTLAQRRKRALTMRKFKNKIAAARKRKSKRLATKDQLVTRAQRAAIMIVRKRFAGKMGQDYKNLSPSQKIQVDKKIAGKKGLVKKLAVRLFSRIRALDQQKHQKKMANAENK